MNVLLWEYETVALNKSVHAQKSFVLYSSYLDYQGREYTLCSIQVTAANLTYSKATNQRLFSLRLPFSVPGRDSLLVSLLQVKDKDPDTEVV